MGAFIIQSQAITPGLCITKMHTASLNPSKSKIVGPIYIMKVKVEGERTHHQLQTLQD
jgi:hypothetical protein